MKPSNKWKLIHVKKDGVLLTGYLHPIGSVRNNKYWSFSCPKAGIQRVSLKVKTHAEAKQVVANWFERSEPRHGHEEQAGAILTWEDWDAIQEAHSNKRSESNSVRAKRTLEECRKAKRLFLSIVEAGKASAVTPDMGVRAPGSGPHRSPRHGVRLGEGLLILVTFR
jgi:hypothetical protein